MLQRTDRFAFGLARDDLAVDDDVWEVGHYDATSFWGHRPPVTGSLPPTIIRPFAEPATT
jgi:hypothetical protein